MAGIEDILSKLPIDEIAAKLGVDKDTAAQAVKEGGATILGGLQKNAASADGAAAIQAALGKHATTTTDKLDDVDTEDGNKILGHIFGGNKTVVEQKLNDDKQTAGIDFGKLLPILAPIVMSVLAKGQNSTTTKQTTEADSGGGIGDIIGGLLGGLGGSSSTSSSSGGLDIGGLLGGLGGLFGKK